MMKYIFLILLFLIFSLYSAFPQGIISANLGSSYSFEDQEQIKPDVGILTGLDLFHSFTDTISLFSSLGGFLNYKYLDNELRYFYNCSLDLSFRGEKALFKPSIKTQGEQFYSQELNTPHTWENSGELYFSYDISSTSIFLSPTLSWEDDNFFVKGKVGYTFSFLLMYVMSLEFAVGKTIFQSENDELYFHPKLLFSWYPDKPYTLGISFAFTWNDSDYESGTITPTKFLSIYDFIEFFSDVEYSIMINEDVNCIIYVPLSLILKRHQAVENELLIEEDEWIFSTGIQVDVGIDLYSSQRCVISLSGEKAFSNSTYQIFSECIVSVAYEFLF